MSYTQEELNSIWRKLMDNADSDEYGELEVSAMVQSFNLAVLKARVLTNTDTEQAIVFGRSVKGRSSDDVLGDYARLRDNKEGPWGEWKKR